MEKENKAKPRAKRKKSQKTNNLPWAFMKAPRCGAKTRKGTPCKGAAMKNGRCRMHGGKSTGPRTLEGIERIRQAHLKHGLYTKEAIASRKELRLLLREIKKTIEKTESEHGRVDFDI